MGIVVTTARDWYGKHGCAHAHCPHGCEHPQPFVDDDTGELLCGRCWFRERVRTPMVPCTPQVCG